MSTSGWYVPNLGAYNATYGVVGGLVAFPRSSTQREIGTHEPARQPSGVAEATLAVTPRDWSVRATPIPAAA